MRTNTIILAAIAAVALTSCKKNADSSMSQGLDFQLRAVNPSSPVARTMATISWDSGFVNATLIKFEAKQNGNETEFKSNVHQHVDLFGAASTVGTINITPGVFEEVEFKVEAAPTSTEPALKLQGSVNGVPVTFIVNNGFEIKSEQSQVTLTGGDIALNKIDLSALTNGLSSANFSSATLTNGTVIISSSSNANLFNIMFSNCEKQGETEVEMHHH